MKKYRFDSIEVHQHPTRALMGSAAADGVAEIVRDATAARGEARVVFACAPSQDDFLDALVWHEIDWTKVVVFHMDEYAGLEAKHPQSFRRYLQKHLLSRIGSVKAFHPIEAQRAPDRECARYAALLAEKPIDLVCLGIGENGHIAYNDPPVADFKDPLRVKLVTLDPKCRQQQVNDGCFPSLADVPEQAITLTVPALFGARAISCVVPGPRKAAAVRSTLLGRIWKACPASILRRHPRTVLHIDDEAASKL